MRDRGNKLFSSEISFVAQIRRVVEGGTEQVSEEAEVEELLEEVTPFSLLPETAQLLIKYFGISLSGVKLFFNF